MTRNFDVQDFQIVVFAWKILQKMVFHGTEFGDRLLSFFKALGIVFLIFSFENTKIFSDITKSESGIWQGESIRYLGLLKTKHSLIAD